MDRCQNDWEGFTDDLAALLEQGKSGKPDADKMIALVDSMRMRVEEGEDFTLPPGADFDVLIDFYAHFAQHPHNYVLKPVVNIVEALADEDCLAAEFAIAWDFLTNVALHAKRDRDTITDTLEELVGLTELDGWEQEIPAAVHDVWTTLEPELRASGINEDALDAMSTALDINSAQAELLAAALHLSLTYGSVETMTAVDVFPYIHEEMQPFIGPDAPEPWASSVSWLVGVDLSLRNELGDDWEALDSPESAVWKAFMRHWKPSDADDDIGCPHAVYTHEMSTNLLAHNLYLLRTALSNEADASVLSFLLSEVFCTFNPDNTYPANTRNPLVRENFEALTQLAESVPHDSSPAHDIAVAIQNTFNDIDAALNAQHDPHAWT